MLYVSLSEMDIRRRLKQDFQHYARKCLKIRTKSGSTVPLELNRAQLHVHQQLESQLNRAGRVRALILKGRQQGISTYVGARFYHKTTNSFGRRTFILTHERPATQNLFAMTKRYHQYCPDVVKASTGASNANELVFDLLCVSIH